MSKQNDDKDHGLSALFSIMSEELALKQPYADAKRVAVERLATRMRKRAKFCAEDSHLSDKAVSDFKIVNGLVGQVSLDLPMQVVRDARYYITVMLERATTSMNEDNIQETLDFRELLDRWRFGPGASNGVTGTHAAEKISQPMTCTAPSEPLVVLLRRGNPYFQLKDERDGCCGTSLVSGSRLTTVPKNQETHRTIAIEPSGNMALQLAAGRYLEDTLRYIGLDIRDQQPKNKAMAHRGSITGGIATIDLKSASDMFSPELVRALLPPEWYWLLMKIRSPAITLPNGEVVQLNMISTMGNGFTFPLMTFILVALIYANRCASRGPNLFIDWTDTCVFGDDIIVPTHEYVGLCKLLEQAGLIVNHDKSFCAGPFRESCGGDYYEGYDVTPFYVSSLENDAAVYVAINQVLEWCGRHEIMLFRTVTYLVSRLRGKVHLVPEWLNPDQGIKTSGCPRRYSFLAPVTVKKRLESHHFAVMLACGGFIDGVKSDCFYTPRLYKTEWRVRHARIPNGFLDGAYRVERPRQTSRYIDVYMDILMTNHREGGAG